MFNKENTTIVIQGNIYPNLTENFALKYREFFDNVIISTWENENIHSSNRDIKVIKSSNPIKPGKGNMNMQIISSFNGLNQANTEYAIKVRSDILIENPQEWIDFFSNYYKEKRIFVLGLSNQHPFSPRDQLMAGNSKMMQKMFNLPLIYEDYCIPTIKDLYPEIYIGLSYYANFDDRVKKFLLEPNKHVIGGTSEEVIRVWKEIQFEYMYPVPRALKYHWPKKFGNGHYNYNETAIASGEFWHEDIIK